MQKHRTFIGEEKTRARLVIYRDCVLPFPNLLHRIVLVHCCTVVATSFFLHLFICMFAQSFFFSLFCVFLSLAYYLLEISLSAMAILLQFHCISIHWPFIFLFLSLSLCNVKFTILRANREKYKSNCNNKTNRSISTYRKWNRNEWQTLISME